MTLAVTLFAAGTAPAPVTVSVATTTVPRSLPHPAGAPAVENRKLTQPSTLARTPAGGRHRTAANGTSLRGAVAASGSMFTVTASPYNADSSGQRDSTLGIRAALKAAENAGPMAIVYIPAGTYRLDLIDGANQLTDLSVTGPNPVVIQGAGSQTTRLVEYVGAANPAVCASGSPDHGMCKPCRNAVSSPCFMKTVVSLRVDGSQLKDVSIDTASFDAGSGYNVVADNTLVSDVVVTHRASESSPPQFPVYYGGQPGATHTDPLYHSGNVINGLTVQDQECDDGISFSFQQQATISNLHYTGSRLALYIDSGVTITDFTYTPGAQSCDTKQGFWITSPSENISISDYVDLAGQGTAAGAGVIGSSDQVPPQTTDNVTISGYRVGSQVGANLRVANVEGLLFQPGSQSCQVAGANKVYLVPSDGITSSDVRFSGCSLSFVQLAPPSADAIQGLLLDGDMFEPATGFRAVLNDYSGVPVAATVSGGWLVEGCGNYIPLAMSSAIQLTIGDLGEPAATTC